jgi:hypothetical protein
MIHFNSLSLAGSNPLTSASGKANQANLDSFESELSDAIASTLQKFGIDPNAVSISIGASTPMKATAPAVAAPAAAIPVTVPTDDASALQASIKSFDDSYWAKQPDAVKALRNMEPEERSNAAAQLMSQGYKIDVPIMMWGWDPAKVTSLRQSYGYTWVPAAGQAPVTAAPGIANVLQPYDPNNPPTGSIMV